MFIVAGILILFASLVYYFTSSTHHEKFRSNLLNRAKNTSIILANHHSVDTILLKKIHQSTFATQNQEIIVADTNFNIIYSFNVLFLTKEQLQLHAGIEKFFSIGAKDGICYRFEFNQRPAYVYLLAYDKARNDYLKELRQILYWSTLFSLWLSVLFSYLFSRKAFKPVLDIINNVKAINSSSLHKRLDEGEKKDELERLAMTFNEMLSDLEKSFKNQEDFVSNASHELRTPISIMIAESDYFIGKEHSTDEYKAHISNQINDIKKLNHQLDSLLHLAQVNRDSGVLLEPVRLDEILFEAVHQIKTKYKNRKIITKIQYPDNVNDMIILGNSGVLHIAFRNIIDNACKFSGSDVLVELLPLADKLKVIITDSGIGIPSSDIENIFKPFNRASNARYKSGFGIGLSLVAKIMELHNATVSAYSQENSGAQFIIEFDTKS